MCSNRTDLHLTLADLFYGSDLPERPSPTSMRLVCIQKARGSSPLSRKPCAVGARRTSSGASAASTARGNAMLGLRGLPNSSDLRRHVYSVGGTPTPLQLVDQYHGSQDGKRYQDEQHDRHGHPPSQT